MACDIKNGTSCVRVVCSSLYGAQKNGARGAIEKGRKATNGRRGRPGRLVNGGEERWREKKKSEGWGKGAKKSRLLRARQGRNAIVCATSTPRRRSILKCYVPGIASCGSRPIPPPRPPFPSMHAKFVLSDQRLRLLFSSSPESRV